VERHLDSNNVASGAILVLGMHRSGTSCLAGSLQQRGLHLGEVYEWRPYNLKGNRENQRIMDLNNAVLAHGGGSWDRPPQHVSWSPAQAAERDAIVRELREGCAGAWGFKDPRTLLTLAFWRDGIADARLVGTFRHPAQVARSLHARDPNMSLAQGLELWRQYNERLLACHEQAAFPLLSFDADEETYRRSVDVAARHLGLAGAPSAEEFFERSLRTSEADPGIDIPAPVMRVYERLLEAAGA
jgi:hypothetical protein